MIRNKYKILAVLIGIILVMVLTSCAAEESTESVENTAAVEDTETKEKSPTVEDGEYDISSNMRVTLDGDEKTVETDYVIIRGPRGSTWECQKVDNTHLYIYNVASREAGYRGSIVGVAAYDIGDNGYEEWRHTVIGEKEDKTYVAFWGGSDVQYDLSNAQTEEDYTVVSQEITVELKD